MKNKLNVHYVKSKTDLAKARAAKQQGVAIHLEIMGSGPINRDGVPSLPPDQREVTNWPVLDLGIHPDISLGEWQLEVKGLCGAPTIFDQTLFKKCPIVDGISDFHCVTGWSQMGFRWRGVRFADVAKLCQLSDKAKYVYFTASDNYSTNLPIEEAMKPDVLLVYEVNGQPLPKEHGGPVRLITPQLWAWKGAKWLNGMEFLSTDRRGFWEERGYSNSAIPWLNDRYSKDET